MNRFQKELADYQALGYVFSHHHSGVWCVYTINQWGSEDIICTGNTLSDTLTNLVLRIGK